MYIDGEKIDTKEVAQKQAQEAMDLFYSLE